MKKQAKKPAPLSIRAYAKRRGVSHQAVMKAIASQRLHKSLVWKHGDAKIADPALADREWKANTDLTRASDVAKARAAAADARNQGSIEKNRTIVDWNPPEPPGKGGSLADWSTKDKEWRAKLAELKFKRAAGELVVAADVEAQLVDVFTTCRTKLLGISNKAKTALPHLSVADLAVLDNLVRESLEDLVPPAIGAAA